MLEQTLQQEQEQGKELQGQGGSLDVWEDLVTAAGIVDPLTDLEIRCRKRDRKFFGQYTDIQNKMRFDSHE